MEHFEQINETSYLSVQNAPVYRKIMRCFYREYEKMHFQLYKEDIYRLLKEDEAFKKMSAASSFAMDSKLYFSCM